MESAQPRIKIVPDIENFQKSIAHLANSLLCHIYTIPTIFIHFGNSCFLLDLHVNLDTSFSFVSIF